MLDLLQLSLNLQEPLFEFLQVLLLVCLVRLKLGLLVALGGDVVV